MVFSLSSLISSGSRCFLSPLNPSINSRPNSADQLSLPSAASPLHLRRTSQATSHLLTAIEPNHHNRPLLSVAFPSLSFSNVLFFKSPCNVEVVVLEEDEPEESLVDRFRREVLRARIIQECRNRRFFESNQEKRKRKSREAARRYRKWRPPPRVPQQDMAKTRDEKGYDSDEDNWGIGDEDEGA